MATAKKAKPKKAKLQYRTIDLRTTAGFRTAERLQAQGWKVGSMGFHTVQMYKKG